MQWSYSRITTGESLRATATGAPESLAGGGSRKERTPATGYAGLINLACGLQNACYQNALLQSLAMTDALRVTALAAPLVPLLTPEGEGGDDGGGGEGRGEGDASAAAATAAEANDDEDAIAFARCALYGLFQHDDVNAAGTIEDEPGALVVRRVGSTSPTPSAEHRAHAQQAAIANRVQWLVARLALSARPFHGTFALKRVLDDVFRGNGQQDVVEFFTQLGDKAD
jgi:hypothetical protein